MNRIKTAALSLALAFSGAAHASPNQETQAPARIKCERGRAIEANVVVDRNADGDTISVRAKDGIYSVRLIGIDTPETHFMGESQGEWGEVASARMQQLLPKGTKVRLELSPSVCDMYGRVLAHVFAGKKHVNKEIIREGLAVNYCLFPSVAHCKELGDLTETAIDEKIGMFSDPTVELPYDFRRRVKGRDQTSFVGSIRTKKVLRPGNQDRIPVAERVFFYGKSSVKAPYKIVD